MSAMTETFDMPMADFSADFDIQMQPSTSESWYQELETKMEEDGPTMFKMHDSPSKNMAITQEKTDDIEVDMEPFTEECNAEYDMVDDEHFHAPTEVHDVELHDADVSIELEQEHTAPPAPLALGQSVSASDTLFVMQPVPVETALLQPSLSQAEAPSSLADIPGMTMHEPATVIVADHIQPLQEVVESTPAFAESRAVDDSVTEAHIAEASDRFEPVQEPLQVEEIPPAISGDVFQPAHESSSDLPPAQEESAQIPPMEHLPEPEHAVATEETHAETHVASDSAEHDETHVESEAAIPEAISGGDLAEQQWTDEADLQDGDPANEGGEVPQEYVSEIAASTGDPHEIAEGVFIDPPPPILISLASGDVFDYCLFNNGEDTLAENQADEHILLANFPTLYYESLSFVFEALRLEHRVQEAFNLTEGELVMEAPDLQLTVTEDNVHARSVSLHELNILHDVSGLDGFLRIRVSQSLPRFIYRYQRLQEEVNRLHLDVGADEGQTVEGGVENDTEQASYDAAEEHHAEYQEKTLPTSDSRQENQDASQLGDLHEQYQEEAYPEEGGQEDIHGDVPEPNVDHQQHESVLPEEVAAGYLAESRNEDSIHEHHSADQEVHTEDGLEHSAERAASDGYHDEHAEHEYGDEEASGDIEHAAVDHAVHEDGFGNEEYDAVVHGDEDDSYEGEVHQADDGDVAATTTSDNNEGETGINTEEQQLGAEDDGSQEFEGDHYEADYDEEGALEYVDYDAEHHEEHLHDGEESSTTDTSGDGSEQAYSHEAAEPVVVREEDVLNHEDDDAEPGALDDLEGVASGSTQGLAADDPSSKSVQDPAEDSHLAPPEHSYDFEDDENWDEEFEDAGGYDDPSWNVDVAGNGADNPESHSNESSVTLSSKASKRNFDEFELDDEGFEDDSGIYGTPPSSPGAKRTRTH